MSTDPDAPEIRAPEILAEAGRRRTFAIISHPDAGKTTLTEKFLLYAGAVQEAGAVKARADRRRATSDWMDMEQQRGISITSTVLQFAYRGHVVNLLDTPGHRDFSEDTYRVLAAADAAIMVLDAAKGIEPQTLKLFEVCRSRQLPIITFVNKFDRPGQDPLDLLDEIERQIRVRPTPATWPVGDAGDFRGVIERATGRFIRFSRTARGATIAEEEIVDPQTAAAQEGAAWEQARQGEQLMGEIGADVDVASFLAGESTPTFFGSALTNFGIRQLLDAVVDLAPAPAPRLDADGHPRPLDAGFSAFAFKVQANMNPHHRDRVAFVRVQSGRFERGMTVVHGRTRKPFATKYAASVFGQERDTIEEAYPGDIVALVNATDVNIGDALYVGAPVTWPPIPTFAPELFATVRPRDVSKQKQFRKGLEQLGEEGVVQVMHRDGDPTPVLAAVGQMQFEVFVHRLQGEFNAPVELGMVRERIARRTDRTTADKMRGTPGIEVLTGAHGDMLALFDDPRWLARQADAHPDWVLDTIMTGVLEG
jgi:peptide chain release factor 3